MKRPLLFVLLSLGVVSMLALPALDVRADQATAAPGAHLKDLSLGRDLYGAPGDPDQLLGKVVVVNIGGA